MSVQPPPQAQAPLTPDQQAMTRVWEDHLKGEFTSHNTDETLATMIEQAEVTHVPVQTGGVGKAALLAFYGQCFIPQVPPDFENKLLSRTVGLTALWMNCWCALRIRCRWIGCCQASRQQAGA